MKSLGREFAWLWAAFAVSTVGTCLAFEAYPLIAIMVLHSGPVEVSLLTATGRLVGAAVMSIPVAFALGWLGFAQLLIVSVIGAAADIAFRAASGSYLKAIVPSKDLLIANGRFEATTWTAISLGPPLGGAAMSLFGPVTTAAAGGAGYG